MKLSENQILDTVREKIENAESFYQSEIEPKVLERVQIFNADKDRYRKLFPKLSQRSELTSSDAADVIRWCLPSLVRIFLGGNDVISVKGRTIEDDKAAAIMQQLINWQLTRLNQGYLILYNWFRDALIYGLGIVKAYWVREWEEAVEKQVVGVEELQFFENNPNIEIVEVVDYGNGLLELSYKLKQLKRNQPVIENVPPFEFIYSPDAKTVKDAEFVAHRKLVTKDYLRRRAKEGWYNAEAVEEAIESGGTKNYNSELAWYLQGTKNAMSDTDKVMLYECYVNLDINGDGLTEPVIVTVANNQILRVTQNNYGRPPFFTLSPEPEQTKLWGIGLTDLAREVQDLKTALVRQLVVNVAINNDPKMFISAKDVNVDDLMNDAAYIRVNGEPKTLVMPFPVQPLAPWTFNFLEYAEQMKENRTGITRYTQGLDAKSLNKTATGISLIMQASNQRLEMIARIFAETGIRELFQFLVELNQRFIDQETVIRLTNKPLTIRPDDLKGQFDLVISSAIGVTPKEITLQHLQLLLSLYPQLMQIGIATPKNVYNCVAKIVETLGFKDVDSFITKPEAEIGQGAGAVAQAGGVGQAVYAVNQAQGAQGDVSGTLEQAEPGDIQGLAELIGGQVAGAEGGAPGSSEAQESV